MSRNCARDRVRARILTVYLINAPCFVSFAAGRCRTPDPMITTFRSAAKHPFVIVGADLENSSCKNL